MLLCFIGVVFIALNRPNQLQEQKTETFGIMLMVVVAWTQAVIFVTNRRLRDVHFAIIGFFHPILGFTVTTSYMFMAGLGMGSHTVALYFKVFVACCFDFLQLCSQNIAFQSDTSGFISLISYISVAYGFIADELIFNESITGMELMGATLILVVCLTTAVLKLRLKKASKS